MTSAEFIDQMAASAVSQHIELCNMLDELAAKWNDATEDLVELTVRFIADHSLISEAIQFVTFSKWSHVEMLLPNGKWFGAHSSGGVEEREYDYTTPSRERRYTLMITQKQYALILAYAQTLIGTKYDFVDVVGLLVHMDIHEQTRRICSWLIVDVLAHGGIFALNVQVAHENDVTPENLHLSNIWIDRCTYQYPKAA